MRRLAEHLRTNRDRIAPLASVEMGKPVTEAEAEVEKCAWNCDYYAEHAGRFLADERVTSTATHSYVAFRPLGVVLAIMPWNFPFWQVFRFAAPALMAGNVAVLKHAANVTECALEIERAFYAAGFPEGAFATLLVPSREMEEIVADPRVAAVTLTGSGPAGSSVAATAGKHLKKTVLELGGSDAFIVLADADVDAAAAMAVKARFQNAGQSCIAAKRFIVVDRVHDAFVQAFVHGTQALRIGDPLDRETQIGPLARRDLRDALERQVRESVAQGARVALGGAAIDGPGAYYAPTIVTEMTAAMPLFREETFGPVAAVVRARDLEHAVELADDSEFGLGGNVWTQNIELARELASRLESGNVFINGMTASDPRLPFGGVKHSGYGRELSSFGIREFVNVQTVWIGPPKTAQGGAAVE
ncbi:MAG: NAD-dependent succinate-semialdehyde dehydrogenase, partial [Candidatus Eremiobacteraeota bacterium]|nr:NAD-dependent succinate-semialdehyde dehydrogenase [Candidatus Eremiobacteraeota bacterium]